MKAQPGGSVILYSGGLDSVIAAHLYPEATLLFLRTGIGYNSKELTHVVEQHKEDLRFKMDDRLFLRDVCDENSVVPSRNAFFVLIASLYAPRIILQGVLGDVHSDKDLRFAELMTDLLNHANRDTGLRYSVEIPFAEKTKSTLVFEYLVKGGREQDLLRAVSCYHPSKLDCGQCRPCVRKWAALENNAIHRDGIWHRHPYLWTQETQESAWAGHVAAIDEIRNAVDIYKRRTKGG